MVNQSGFPQPTLKNGDNLYGFQVIRVKVFPEIRVTAYEIEHIKTDAKILHIHSFDRENLYAIGFRTPPPNSTGLPHILEHSVLAGSDKYPLKDVFKELMRSTLQTFINAFTYPDKTIYPVASQIEADFFNLARVYTDLVLHPRLMKETFMQEGHHLEFSTPDDTSSELIISGIVYNEMKGAYSSPDSLMYKAIQENLYPQSVYAFDSGGDPDVIPSLTYEQFCEFHRKYYSPTNARFFIYGDIPTARHLEFLAEMLKEFDRTEVDSTIASQKQIDEPHEISGTYPVNKDEDLVRKAYVNIAWMMSENIDYENSLVLEIVSGLLVGNAASPLRKALIDSGLGEDLSPVSGIESDLKQLLFCVGLRNIESADAKKIEELIFATLQKIVADGFESDLIEGVLHQVEFHGKEIVRGSYPYGIYLMGNVFQTWLYDGDPLIGLDFSAAIEKIRNLWAADSQLFQKTVQKWFLDNRHRLLAIMEPDPDFSEKQEKAFQEKMANLKKSLRDSELKKIKTQAARLKKFQAIPDSEDAAATLPKLSLTDIPRSIETIPGKTVFNKGIQTIEHEMFTNGIAYVDLAFDIAHVPEELQLYLPIMGKIMCGMGAGNLTYEDIAKRIALKMGGFGYDLATGFSADASVCLQKMIFSFKSLYRNLPEAMSLTADILTAGDLDNEARIHDLLAERKNNLQAAVVPSGHVFAKRAAGAALTLPAYRDEQWNGRTQLRFIKSITDKFQKDKKNLPEKLEKLRKIIFSKDNLVINLTADAAGLQQIAENMSRLLDSLPQGNVRQQGALPSLAPVYAGIAVPTQVSYVAKVLKAPAYIDPACAILLIAAKELSNNYLYKYIRVQGGAYGGMSSFDLSLGLFSFMSYRDPHITETLKIFDDAAAYLSKKKLSADELEKAIIGTIGMMDRPMDPAGKGYVAFMRHFAGITDEMRQKFRDDILSATPEKVKDTMKKYYAEARKSSAVAVYSAEEKLQEANSRLEHKLNLENLLED